MMLNKIAMVAGTADLAKDVGNVESAIFVICSIIAIIVAFKVAQVYGKMLRRGFSLILLGCVFIFAWKLMELMTGIGVVTIEYKIREVVETLVAVCMSFGILSIYTKLCR